jgi:hypothetical protein
MTKIAGFMLALYLPLSLAAAACMAAPRTQIIVRVDSDMPIRPNGGLTGIEIVVRTQEAMERARYPVQLSADPTRPSRYFPLDLFAIEPLRGDSSRAVTVEATALDGMDRLFTVRAVASFVAGRTSVLELFLAGQCRARVDPCPPEYSCSRGGECVMDHRVDLPPLGDSGAGRDVPTASMVPDAMSEMDAVAPVDTYVPPMVDVPNPPDPQMRCVGVGRIHGDGCCPPNSTWCQDNDCAQSRMRGDGCCSPALENACVDPESCPVAPNDGCCASALGENCLNSFADCTGEPACLCAIRCCDNSLQLSQQPSSMACSSHAVRAGACPRLRVRYGDALIFERSIACP